MDAPGTLPDGLTARALTFDDIDEVITLVNACELDEVGFPMWEREDMTCDFRLESNDIALDTVGVWDDSRIVGWGFLPNERGAWADVHPERRGHGIGTWLRLWTEDRARARSADRIGQTINDRAEPSFAFLVAAGYTPRHTSWILEMEHRERPADPILPPDVALRGFEQGDADEALAMFEQAFADDRPHRSPTSLSAWRTMTIERDGFEPEDLILAVSGGEVVGGAFVIDSDGETWVDKFAVRRDHRHRGIARALLQVVYRRAFDRGFERTRLSTDSDIGAITFYERVGMRIVESYTHLAIDL